AAHTAHDQIDLDARLRRLVERVDQWAVGQAVHLDGNPTAAPELALALDLLDQRRAQRARRDDQLAIGGLLAAAGQIVEQLRGVGGERRRRAEQPEVFVRTRSLWVIV